MRSLKSRKWMMGIFWVKPSCSAKWHNSTPWATLKPVQKSCDSMIWYYDIRYLWGQDTAALMVLDGFVSLLNGLTQSFRG